MVLIMINKIKSVFNEYPAKFWVLVSASFIDNIGRTMIGPFLALYITQKLGVGMTEAGIVIALFMISGMIGSTVSGALTDKIGRKTMLICGLVFSAVSSLAMAFADQLYTFYLIAAIIGLFSNMGAPARMAMVADILPEQQRAEGFGTLRVGNNMAWIIGPMIGGILAKYSFFLLFIIDIISSLTTAFIVLFFLAETRPDAGTAKKEESFAETFKGYGVVFRDKKYIFFLLITSLLYISYRQCYAPLSVFMNTVHGFTAGNYGLLISINAVLVVIFQLPLSRIIKKYPPYLVLITGTFLLLAGLLLFSAGSDYFWFVGAMLVVTIAEMLLIPVGQSLVASFSPEDMRGRYMAINTLSWTLPAAVAPLLAGIIMDNFNPLLLWYLAAFICFIAALGFFVMHYICDAKKMRVADKESI